MSDCTEPNRAACLRLCQDFCHAQEEHRSLASAAGSLTVDQMATEMGLECCDFWAKDPRDCDVCSAAKEGELIWVQMVGAYEGGTQEAEYYACSSCVAVKHAENFSSENR
jgi:hypothetical protein